MSYWLTANVSATEIISSRLAEWKYYEKKSSFAINIRNFPTFNIRQREWADRLFFIAAGKLFPKLHRYMCFSARVLWWKFYEHRNVKSSLSARSRISSTCNTGTPLSSCSSTKNSLHSHRLTIKNIHTALSSVKLFVAFTLIRFLCQTE